jgi:hypothetical protein
MTALRLMPKPADLGRPVAFCVGEAVREFEKWKEAGSPQLSERMVMGFRLPSWQRPFVWTEAQSVKLVESLWMGLTIGTYTFNRDRDEGSKFDNLLIDGQQRMKALEDYLTGKFPVFGYRWEETTEVDKRTFRNTIFGCYITDSTDETYLKGYYNMMNFGGVAHKESERA